MPKLYQYPFSKHVSVSFLYVFILLFALLALFVSKFWKVLLQVSDLVMKMQQTEENTCVLLTWQIIHPPACVLSSNFFVAGHTTTNLKYELESRLVKIKAKQRREEKRKMKNLNFWLTMTSIWHATKVFRLDPNTFIFRYCRLLFFYEFNFCVHCAG